MNINKIYEKNGYSMNFCSRKQYSKKYKSEVICKSSFDGYLHSSVGIDNKILAILIDYKLKNKDSNKPLQIRNKVIAERIESSISGVKKAFTRLEKLGLLKRCFYKGKFRNIFLNMELVDQYSSQFVIGNKESELYNIKTPSDIKKIKHGGFSRIDITRRRVLRDLLHSKRCIEENEPLQNKREKMRQFKEFLKMQLSRRKYYKDENTVNKLIGNLKNKERESIKPDIVDPEFEKQLFRLISTWNIW